MKKMEKPNEKRRMIEIYTFHFAQINLFNLFYRQQQWLLSLMVELLLGLILEQPEGIKYKLKYFI